MENQISVTPTFNDDNLSDDKASRASVKVDKVSSVTYKKISGLRMRGIR